jgi:hypothetical protein
METIKIENKKIVVEVIIDDVGWATWGNKKDEVEDEYTKDKLADIEEDICHSVKKMFESEIVYVKAKLVIEDVEKNVNVKKIITTDKKMDSRLLLR